MPDSALKKIDAATAQVERGSDLVHRLMEFSRGGEAITSRVNLREPVESILELCRAHPAAKQRTINNLIPDHIPSVTAHTGSLQEIVLNLVLNALQATDPGGEIRIEAEVYSRL